MRRFFWRLSPGRVLARLLESCTPCLILWILTGRIVWGFHRRVILVGSRLQSLVWITTHRCGGPFLCFWVSRDKLMWELDNKICQNLRFCSGAVSEFNIKFTELYHPLCHSPGVSWTVQYGSHGWVNVTTIVWDWKYGRNCGVAITTAMASFSMTR